ncbi:MAG: tryptophan--tRNA ligase [Acidobacteriota bacterium]|jgi:tryptophanyl-tRNA synthetase|nr:tryptophan--tRNA ligase [Acidobacteriota bacterium]
MTDPAKRLTILSGIQPSGNLHLGNYFGAVQQFIQFIGEGHECYYFLANYHALTTVRDKGRLIELTRGTAADYIALGLDPARAAIYVQSDIPEVCELQWLLTTVTPMGLLERCHAYKDKLQKGIPADHGLFAYPVLMAADILIVRADRVPVGQDQKQHVEVARDIVGYFNGAYGDVLTMPEPYIPENVAVVPGRDGQKMSKSYNNTIELFAPDKVVKKQISSIVTDLAKVEDPKDPDTSTLYAIMKLFCTEEEKLYWADRFRAGGLGYGDAKAAVYDLYMRKFADMRARRRELDEQPEYVDEVLRQGAEKARKVALPLVRDVRAAMGIPNR